MKDLKLFFSNLRDWVTQYPVIVAYYRYNDASFWWLVRYLLYWTFDVLVNVLTGGDRYESVSSRVYKDRHSSAIARAIWKLTEWFIGDGHGEKVVLRHTGEGSTQNTELSRVGQGVAVVSFLSSVVTAIWFAVTEWL